MKIWAKIKCFFGFCKDFEKLKLQQTEAINGVYKVEPKVQTLDIKEEFGNKVNETLYIIGTNEVKVKRHWFNNGKTQKLVPEGEEKTLPKTWKKGRLKKSEKKDK